jgi:hypothetical protein
MEDTAWPLDGQTMKTNNLNQDYGRLVCDTV